MANRQCTYNIKTAAGYLQECNKYWEIFEAQNFRGWVPFANKFLRMAF